MLDGHIHIRALNADSVLFQCRLETAGISGGLVISFPPASYTPGNKSADPGMETILEDLMAFCAAKPNRYPFFWIDPLADTAAEQVERAVTRGVKGFKIICDRFAPGDARAMKIIARIAAAGRPILFHSGILWDGKPSSPFNRPSQFEPLLAVAGLRFCLAHISWPWCDELIAVYGKFLNARTKAGDCGVEMFVDTTPGTPPLYRREALMKLYGTGYDVRHNAIFGTDSQVNAYNTDWARQWIERDSGILAEAGLDASALDDYFGGNLQRFVDPQARRNDAALPRVGE